MSKEKLVNTPKRMRYPKVLEVGPIAPPHAGWSVRMQYVLDDMRRREIECDALDVGPNRKIRRPGCEPTPTAFHYLWKVFWFLCRGYRLHHHLNGDSPKAYLMVLWGCVLSWLFRRPACLTWHGGVPQKWFPKGRNYFADWMHWMIFHLCETIICNDQKIKDLILQYGVADAAVVPIQAFSVQYLQYEDAPPQGALADFLAAAKTKLFVYAYYRPEFNLPVLLEGLAKLKERLPKLGVVLVGYKQGSKEVEERIQTLGLQDTLYLAGDLHREAFLSTLSRCDLMVRTPQRDGISSSVFEGLGLGVPVVAAANALRPRQVWQYPAEDAEALAATVQKVLSLPLSERRPRDVEIPDTVLQEIEVLTGAEPALAYPGV